MDSIRKDILPAESLGFVGEVAYQAGLELSRSGHVTVHPGSGTLHGTVGEAGHMPVAVEIRLPIGPNRPPRCTSCGSVWCRHAVAVALRSRDRSQDTQAGPGSTVVVERTPVPIPPHPVPHEWWAKFSDDDPGWFRLELGIVLEERRVDLVPVFQQILRDKSLDILRAWILTGRPYPVRLPQGPVVGIPAERMIRIAQALEAVLEGKGTPRIPRMEAVLLEDLGIENWTVPPSLAGLRERLSNLALPTPSADPAGLAFPLREYQRQGTGWLRFLADLGFGGVLADDMGLGKTIQTLAHLLEERERGRLSDAALVVCPTSLVTNWMRETARLAPGLRAIAHHGPDRGASALSPHVDLVVTSYPLLVRDAALLAGRRWSVAVFDEAHMLKNPSAQAAHAARRLPADRRLALTGTPLENHLGELWSILDLVAPGVLGTRSRFREAWRKPIEERNDRRKASEMGRRIAPFLLRRTKFQVASELPSKTEIVQMLELPEAQRDVYEAVRARADRKVRDEIHRVGLEKSGAVVLEALLRLRQCCCDPRLLPEAVSGTAGPSAKLAWLLESLPSMLEEGRRVLLFSQFSSMLRLLSKELERLGIRHSFLTGDTVDRTAEVDRFQSGEVPVFLLSLKAGGSGLNLTAADTVVLWDPWWNPAAEAQAVDRAHRIGQDKPVFVYRLLATSTVEERVALLQEKKRNLVRGVVDGAPSAFHLSAAELRDLLSS